MEWEDLPTEIQELYIAEVNKAQGEKIKYELIIERFNKTAGFGDKKQGLFDWDKSTDRAPFWDSIIKNQDLEPFYKRCGNKNENDWIDIYFTTSEKADILNRCYQNVIAAGNWWSHSLQQEYYIGFFPTKKDGGFNFEESTEGENFWVYIQRFSDYEKAIEILNNKSKSIQHVERTSSACTESKYTITFESVIKIEGYSPTGRHQIFGGGCKAELAGRNE